MSYAERGKSRKGNTLRVADAILRIEAGGWPTNYTPSSQQEFGGGGRRMLGPFGADKELSDYAVGRARAEDRQRELVNSLTSPNIATA